MRQRKHLMALLLAVMTLPGISIALLVRALEEPKEQVAVKSKPTLILTPYLQQRSDHLILTPYEDPPVRRGEYIIARAGRRTSKPPVGRLVSRSNRTPSNRGCSGYSGYQWLECKESTFSPTARNGQHYGLGQLNNNARAAQAKKLGIDPNTSDPDKQRQMMKGYVEDRYGSPEAAIAHHQRKGWY